MLPLQVNIALVALRVALSQEYLCVDHGLAASRTWESEASLRGERALALFKEQNRLLLRELQRRLTAQVRSATSAGSRDAKLLCDRAHRCCRQLRTRSGRRGAGSKRRRERGRNTRGRGA